MPAHGAIPPPAAETTAVELTKLLDAFLAAAVAELCMNPPGRVVKVPGTAAAWDDCCSGQLHIRVVGVAPILRPRKSVAGPACDTVAWRYRLAMGVTRCAATINDQGAPPTPDQLAVDTSTMLDDMDAVRAAIESHADTLELTSWAPLGPTGGCHGGEWQFQVRLAT